MTTPIVKAIFKKTCSCGNEIVVSGIKWSDTEAEINCQENPTEYQISCDGATAGFIGKSTVQCSKCGKKFYMGNRNKWYQKIFDWS